MAMDDNDIRVMQGVVAQELKPVYMAIEKTGDKTIEETRKAIDEVRKAIEEARKTADEARRTADDARRSADDAHAKAEKADKEAKAADAASIQRDNNCPVKAKIEVIEISLAKAKGVILGVRWTTGKIAAAIAFLLISGAGIIHFIEKISTACAACGK